jgi:G:T-mismatch repair DNA endonuclease (very short patch repair protein)
MEKIMSTNIYPIKQCVVCSKRLYKTNTTGYCQQCLHRGKKCLTCDNEVQLNNKSGICKSCRLAKAEEKRNARPLCQCVDNCGQRLNVLNKDKYIVGHHAPATCVICEKPFSYIHRGGDCPVILTCSKDCKNEFASRQSTEYFENPDNREKTRVATQAAMDKLDMKQIIKDSGYVHPTGEDHHRYGVELPQSQIDQQREKVSGDKHHLFGKTYEEYYGEEKAAKIKQSRAECMAETNTRLIEIGSSSLERKVFLEHFEDRGFIHGKKIHRFVVDYFNEDKNVIVEFHGTFWHAHPSDPRFQDEKAKHPSLNKTVESLRKQDEYRKQKLESFGYKVIILWECDYKQDPVKAIEQVFSNF